MHAPACRSTYLGEHHDLVDAHGASLCHVVNHVLAIGQAEDARHGGDGLVGVALLVHEDGQDEV